MWHAWGKRKHTEFWLEYLKKRLSERPRCRLEDNIKTDLKEVGWEEVH
jgi:hypothetical protein